MSTQHDISVTLELDGDPITNAVVTLTDRASIPTYGIRTAVGNTVVVAAGTSVPHVAATPGTYTFPFTTGTAGTAYEAVVKIVWPDGDIDFVDKPFTLASTAQPFTHYGTLLDVQNQGGRANVITYSNLDGRREDPDYDRIQIVMDQQAERVTDYLRGNFITKPEPGTAGFLLLTAAWALWTLKALYTSRGDLDVKSDSEGEVSSAVWDRDARRLLRLYVMNRRGGNITPQFAIG